MKDFNFVEEKGIDTDKSNNRYDDMESSPQSELYAKKHPIEKIVDNLIEYEDKDPENGGINGEYPDAEISILIQDAIVKLKKIRAYANQQKKQVVIELAKNLEGKIATDTICMEIVNQLRGQVHERFVRECLDEKYKQKPRMENARKQKKQKQVENKEDVDKLAAVTPLNQAPKNDKIILVAHGNQELVQSEGEGNDKPFTDTDNESTEDDTESLPPKLSYLKEHEQKLGPRNEPVDQNERPCCKELYYENLQLKEALGKLNQFTSADTMKSEKDAKNDANTTNKILEFEFCLPYKDVNRYIESLQKYDDFTKVWFNGKFDTSTGMIFSSGFGRIRKHLKQVPLTSESIDNDDEWEDVVG